MKNHSKTYPDIDEALDLVIVGFAGLDWDYFDVRGLIVEIKQLIPKESRDYDPETKQWAIDKSYRPVLDELIKQHFG